MVRAATIPRDHDSFTRQLPWSRSQVPQLHCPTHRMCRPRRDECSLSHPSQPPKNFLPSRTMSRSQLLTLHDQGLYRSSRIFLPNSMTTLPRRRKQKLASRRAQLSLRSCCWRRTAPRLQTPWPTRATNTHGKNHLSPCTCTRFHHISPDFPPPC